MAVTTPETVTPEERSSVRAPIDVERAPGRWITHWDPEDEAFWEGGGRAIARRNLIFSILAEHLGFSVWVMWSIVTVNLNNVGFAFTESQLFWLVAIPSLVGATLRLPYTFAVDAAGSSVDDLVVGLRTRHPGGRIVAASYLLAPGHFHDRVLASGADDVTAPLLADGPPDPRMVELVVRRYQDGWLANAV